MGSIAVPPSLCKSSVQMTICLGCFSSNSHRTVILRGCDFIQTKLSSRLSRLAVEPERSVAEGPAVSFCPSHLTAPNKSQRPQLVIPSVAEGPAVRPGSRTKVSVSLVLPQNRHPACPGSPWERSASQIDRVTHRLWRGVEGPRRCLSCPGCSELFDHRSPTTGSALVAIVGIAFVA
jgi:hypothetical protein